MKESDAARLPQQIGRAFAQSDPILVWFHGGLVPGDAGRQTAQMISNGYEGDAVYPLFFIWETGPSTAIHDALIALLRRKLGTGTIDLLTRLLNVKLNFGLGLGIEGGDPYELTAEEEAILLEAAAVHPDLEAEAVRLAFGQTKFNLSAVVDGPTYPRDEKLDRKLKGYFEQKRQEELARNPAFSFDIGGFLLGVLAKFVLDVARSVLARYRVGRQHALKETIIEEALRLVGLGTETWTQIKDDAKAAFDDNPRAVGRLFVDQLRQELAQDPNRKIILVGHSAGAIYICHLLQEIKRAGISHKFDLRFLAPAARFDLVEDTLRRCEDLVGSIRYFALTDRQEREEALLAGAPVLDKLDLTRNLYMGSLLYLVSGSLEPEGDSPIFGMQRFIDFGTKLSTAERNSISFVVDFIRARDSNGIVWSSPNVQGSPGYVTWSTTHGGFDEDAQVRKSVLS